MKKLLIGTTALVAAGLIAGDAAAADKIKAGISGYIDQYIGFSENDSTYNNGQTDAPNLGGFDVQSDAEVVFAGSTKLDNGLTVGIEFEMEGDAGAKTMNVDQSFVTVSSAMMGTVTLGAHPSPVWLKHNSAPAASKFGLELGDAQSWVTDPGLTDQTYTNSIGAGTPYGVSYTSPSFSGVTVAATYYPENSSEAQAGVEGVTADDHTVGAIIAYSGKFNDVTIGLDAGYTTMGSQDTTTSTNRDELAIGAKVGFGAFTVAGGWKDVDSSKIAGTTSTDGNVWSVGGMYTSGPLKLSLSWMHSELEGAVNTAADDEVDQILLAAGYDLGGGVSLSLALNDSSYDDETTTATNSNDGWAAVAGVQVAF